MEAVLGIIFGIGIPGAVIITWIFFRSKERQMLIQKGFTNDQIISLYSSKKNPYIWLKLGIIVVFFGIGLGVGGLLENLTNVEMFLPFGFITFTGLGFVVGYYVSRKFEKEDQENEV
ncbi:MAG: hypothetical protein JEY94_03570 [Melioribacteraceae bacterium]|nr:hypothetical protein [Melioribacteraceae bacterium]